MDIKILDSWLRDYLKTNAKPEKIGEALSLCGPSVERIKKEGKESVYDIEITTNRIDTVSTYGIAREAAAILPRFGIPAKLAALKDSPLKYKFVKRVDYLTAIVDPNLCPRFSAVLIKNVTVDHSPNWIIERLEKSGVRAINNIVDISNYIMLDLGQPVHTFDYDKIRLSKMVLRESKKGESITTLDGKTFTLKGGDIVIEDGEGRLIDLAGVMGGNLSMVDENTKNVLLFVQTYNPVAIRKTSMGLAQRTLAATIFEKGTDTELVTPAIFKGIELFEKNCKGQAEKEILNIYPRPFKPVRISVSYDQITKKLGINITKPEIIKILTSLEFEASWKGNNLEVIPPSWRARDILIEEDIVEEIARIYGYHNLPSIIMSGDLPRDPQDKKFEFEDKVKDILTGFGGVEVYTLSLVPKDYTDYSALKLKNPLGEGSEYLRTSLMPSLISAAKSQSVKDNFFLYEMANVYIPRKGDLPDEKLTLAGIFSEYDYRSAKGIVEALMMKLGINTNFISKDMKGFPASKSAQILSGKEEVGIIGVTDDKFIYWEFSVDKLQNLSGKNLRYKEISKYPSQIEDVTFVLPERTKVGEVIELVSSVSNIVYRVTLKDIYGDAFTFRIDYHSDSKTLTDKDVEVIRQKVISEVKTKFGGTIKE